MSQLKVSNVKLCGVLPALGQGATTKSQSILDSQKSCEAFQCYHRAHAQAGQAWSFYALPKGQLLTDKQTEPKPQSILHTLSYYLAYPFCFSFLIFFSSLLFLCSILELFEFQVIKLGQGISI